MKKRTYFNLGIHISFVLFVFVLLCIFGRKAIIFLACRASKGPGLDLSPSSSGQMYVFKSNERGNAWQPHGVKVDLTEIFLTVNSIKN